MGMRAYRIINIEVDNEPLYKVGDNLYDYLEDNGFLCYGDDGDASIEHKDLETTLKEFKFEEEDYRLEVLKHILKEEKGEEYITFKTW